MSNRRANARFINVHLVSGQALRTFSHQMERIDASLYTVIQRIRSPAKLRKKMADSDKGIPESAKKWTVAEYLTYWLEHVVKSRRPKTYQGYERILGNYLIPGLEKEPASTDAHRKSACSSHNYGRKYRSCAEGIDARREVPRCCAIKDCCHLSLSVRSIRFVHAALRNALQSVMREELVSRNAAKLIQVETPNYRAPGIVVAS